MHIIGLTDFDESPNTGLQHFLVRRPQARGKFKRISEAHQITGNHTEQLVTKTCRYESQCYQNSLPPSQILKLIAFLYTVLGFFFFFLSNLVVIFTNPQNLFSRAYTKEPDLVWGVRHIKDLDLCLESNGRSLKGLSRVLHDQICVLKRSLTTIKGDHCGNSSKR